MTVFPPGRGLHLAGPLAFAILAGCTSVPNDLGRSDVDAIASARGLVAPALTPAEAAALQAEIASSQLNLDTAVRLALVNNPGLRAKYASIGVAAADVYEAGRIRNPVFSAAVMDSNASGDLTQTTFSLVGSFTDLVTLPARARYAKAEYAAVKQDIAAAALAVAADASSAYYDYASARQVLALRARVAKAAALSADLAQRFSDAGNLAPRELALELAAAAEADIDRLAAEAEVAQARDALGDILGLSTGDAWEAPAQLLALPDSDDALSAFINLARSNRLDVSAARLRADALADRLGVTNWTRWLGELDIGAETGRETDGTEMSGFLLDWEIPLFSQNLDRRLRASAELQQAIAEVAQTTLRADNDVRLAYAGLQTARARAESYRDKLIPARIAASARTQEEQNFMLVGVFEMIVTKQQEYDAYQGYLEAVRDYWLARADLGRASGTILAAPSNTETDILDTADYLRPAPAMNMEGMDHSGHGGMAMEGMDHTGHDMGGMEGMDMSADMDMEGMDHTGHDMGGMEDMNMSEDMDMEGMDPSGHGGMAMEGMDHTGHDMSGMDDMDMSEDVEEADHSGHDTGESDAASKLDHSAHGATPSPGPHAPSTAPEPADGHSHTPEPAKPKTEDTP